MKSVIALAVAVLFIACLFALLMPSSAQWNTMWALAPVVAGLCGCNLYQQVKYLDTLWETASSLIALAIFGVLGWVLGIYAFGAYAEIGSLTNEVMVFGGLTSFGLLTIGVLLAWVTSPAEGDAEEAEPTTQPG